MAERNPRIPHSIESLLFVNRNGKYCGYKQGLISDNIGADLREFLICAECEGISRRARQGGGNTVCELCVPEERIVPEVLLVDINPIPVQYYGDIDKRVENKVAFLNARCPLSGEGCGWEGKLREIEQHMEECQKVRVECQLECGNVLERESIEQHNREICSLRIKRCDYCNEEVQANEENQHIVECQYHPDTEVPCPYKELGCEAIVLRKNMNTHITENMTDHHTLMLYQLNQLRDKNKQQERVNQQLRDNNVHQQQVNQERRNRITTIERSATDREREQTMERKEEIKRNWISRVITMVTVGISIIIAATIGIPVAVNLANNIKTNSKEIASSLNQAKFNSQQIKFNLQLIESNLNQTEFNSSETEQQIKSHLQLIESLLSNAGYIYEYIEERRKALLGIEWIYNLERVGTFYGHTFYLGQCKLTLEADVTIPGSGGTDATYYVERVDGDYDDSVVKCILTYTYASFWYQGATQPEDTDSNESIRDLQVMKPVPISSNSWAKTEGKGVVRVYFDTAGA